jgi:hypothetical protein
MISHLAAEAGGVEEVAQELELVVVRRQDPDAPGQQRASSLVRARLPQRPVAAHHQRRLVRVPPH